MGQWNGEGEICQSVLRGHCRIVESISGHLPCADIVLPGNIGKKQRAELQGHLEDKISLSRTEGRRAGHQQASGVINELPCRSLGTFLVSPISVGDTQIPDLGCTLIPQCCYEYLAPPP